MDYFPQGWNQFSFLVTPEEWEALISGFHQVTFCSRVPKGYVESPPETLTTPWASLYQKLQGAVPVDFKADRECFNWADGLTNDLNKCGYTAPFWDESTKGWFQRADFAEPCVSVQPFAMTIGEDGRLYTKFHYSQMPQWIAGLELHYPKNIAYFNEARDGYSKVIPCGDTETYCQVYEPLIQRLRGITTPLCFSAGGKNYRPKVRISSQAKEDFPRFWFAREYQIQLK